MSPIERLGKVSPQYCSARPYGLPAISRSTVRVALANSRNVTVESKTDIIASLPDKTSVDRRNMARFLLEDIVKRMKRREAEQT